MNSKLIAGIIIIIVLGIGGYFLLNQKMNNPMPDQGHNPTNMSAKPVSKPTGQYQLEVTSDTSDIKPGEPEKFTFKVKNANGEVFKKYEVAHEKLMHFIGVRKDLTNFLHLHPQYNEVTGEFSIDIPFPEAGPYRLYPDFTPGIDNPDKQPVTLFTDVQVGNPSEYLAKKVTPDTQTRKTYGNYDITFDFPKEPPKAKELTFGLTVESSGQPVTNLENYLGALGHSVIIKEGTLDFIHTHANDSTTQGQAMQHNSMSSTAPATKGPKITFTTAFPDSGVYKIFTQFQHQGKLTTTDYTIQVN